MTQSEIVALRCPSCGGGLRDHSGENASDNKYYCEGCGTTCVLEIERDIAPTEEPWLAEAKEFLASGGVVAAIRVVHKANKGMGLYEAKVMVDTLRETGE